MTTPPPVRPHRRTSVSNLGLDDDDTVVIRGGNLDPAVLRADAERYHGVHGEFGISVFATRDATVEELAQEVPLVRFETPRARRRGITVSFDRHRI